MKTKNEPDWERFLNEYHGLSNDAQGCFNLVLLALLMNAAFIAVLIFYVILHQ